MHGEQILTGPFKVLPTCVIFVHMILVLHCYVCSGHLKMYISHRLVGNVPKWLSDIRTVSFQILSLALCLQADQRNGMKRDFQFTSSLMEVCYTRSHYPVGLNSSKKCQSGRQQHRDW